MDLSNRPRHTHRALSRLQSEARTDARKGRWQAADSAIRKPDEAVAAPRSTESVPGGPLPVDYDAPDGQWLEEPGNASLTALADEIAEQACLGMDFSDEERVEIADSMRRILSEARSRQGAQERTAPAAQPAELLQSLRRASGPQTELPRRPVDPLTIARTVVQELRPWSRPAPRVESLPGGQRIETYEAAGDVTKDALGRVVEARSAAGERILFQYDSGGNLDSFVRLEASGRVHSEGRRDKHGAVVRDPQGRVRAAGESMTVDPSGCVCIHNFDGQFVSLDLLRGVHIERRRQPDADGHWKTVTAVFAHDGFRMATRFHDLERPPSTEIPPFQSAPSEHIRFYGRDGSLVEFLCEEELRDLRPSRVLRPGSVPVDAFWRGKRQACTAWEAVQEYLSIIS